MNSRRLTLCEGLGMALALMLCGLYLTACLSSDATGVTPTPTKTSRPAGADLVARPSATPTVLPSSTPTVVATPTDQATLTPSPTPSPTADLDATSTPWPTLAADVCPLSGVPVSDPSLLERRPLAIKIQNAPISRPQYGLSKADIVYEHLSEAGITRFTALYLCQEVEKVGSIRSARFIDLEIPAMYKSLMAFSGTSPGLYPKFLNADFADCELCFGWGLHSDAFYRDMDLRKQGVPVEHTLFADPTKIWAIAEEEGVNERQDLEGTVFADAVPAGGEAAEYIKIPYPHRDMVVEYRYDPESGAYQRWDGGEPHVDALTDKQISVTNVVVVYANHVDTDIYEDEPRRNHPSVQIQLWGSGPAVIFRDGQAFEGLWVRPKRQDMLVFRDLTGQIPIPSRPGNTWIQLAPLEGHRWTFEATWSGKE